MQPYINKYVERAMSQTPVKPQRTTLQENVTSRVAKGIEALENLDGQMTPSPQSTEKADSDNNTRFQRTYSVHSPSPESNFSGSPVMDTVKFVGDKKEVKNHAVKRTQPPAADKENVSKMRLLCWVY